jgi:AcrR family transcriptional regulator
MTRYRENERQEAQAHTRRRLLDAAVAEFSQAGFASASVESIASAAGLAKGTLYNHFPSKRALMLTLIDEIGAQHLEFITTCLRQENAPVARLRAFFRAGFAYVEQHLAAARLALTTLNSPDPEFNARLYAAYLPMFNLLAEEVLLPGVAAGAFRACQPLATASLLMTLYLGSAASIDPAGKPFMHPDLAADFALAALEMKGVSAP